MIRRFFLFAILLVFSPGCSRPKGPPPISPKSPAQNPALYPCSKQSGERGIEFSGSLLLNDSFLPRRGQQREFREAIREQLRFLVGFLDNGVEKILLSSREPEVAILAENHTTYGMDLTLDSVPHSDAPYVKRALARGFTRAGDPAMRVFYRVKLVLAYCMDSSPLLTSIKLPIDPYLAYWIVEKRDIAFEGTTTKTNPCAAPAIAKINFSQHYWWVFDPMAKGRDADGREFDCSKLLRSERELGTLDVRITEPEKNSFRRLGAALESSKETLQATVIFGPTQYQWSMAPEVRAAGTILRRVPGAEELGSYLDQAPAAERHLHAEAFRFLRFWSRLAPALELSTSSLSLQKNHLLISVTGRLKKSGREIRISTYFGSVDTTKTEVAEHWPYFLAALKHSDILLYFGRAGLGETMSLAALARDLKLRPKVLERDLSEKPYQLLGIVAPHAYTFFGSDIVRARRGKRQRTDLFLTTNFGRPKLLVGLFGYLDALLAGESKEWSEWASLDPDESLYVASFESPRRKAAARTKRRAR